MRLLLLTHSFNSLAQRLWLELEAEGHELSLELDINDAATREAVALWRPEVVVAPFLKRAIPADVWQAVPCLVVHPGPIGDRGPSALDWAIQAGRAEWGVTVLQAVAEMDAGPVWAARAFPLRAAAKSSIYRREVTEAAVAAVLEALHRIERRRPPLLMENRGSEGVKPPMRQAHRRIDWRREDSATVLAKIHAADGQPGVIDRLAGHSVRLHDAWPAPLPGEGPPGTVIGRAGEAILRTTRDGALWIGHLGLDDAGIGCRLKLPAALALERLGLPLPPPVAAASPAAGAPNRVTVETMGDVALIRFPFLNGAMSIGRCRALEAAIRAAAAGPARVLLLSGGPEFWSNGLDLVEIEAATSPAEASLAAIEAMDDVCLALLEAEDKWVMAGVGGNAGAGGVFLALAADRVVVREGVVSNPHYKNMGNLYGSEYWTYLLPRRLGETAAGELMASRLPLAAERAVRLGLYDTCLAGDPAQFETACLASAARFAADPGLAERLLAKREARRRDAAIRPLADYRRAELAAMRLNFFGFDTSYHVARFDFVARTPHSRTPLHLARHRRSPADSRGSTPSLPRSS